MSAVDVSLKYLEKAGDYLNAILVKETRQSLKSRQFIVTFMLLLLASWLISVFMIAVWGDSINYGSSGQTLFYAYFIVLSVAVTVIVPFGAYRSLLGEKEQNTFDALRITSLTPWQIVWGKLLSALLQVFIFYSAIAPFIAFTSLLEGFELPSVAFVLVCGLLASLSLIIFSLMISTFATQRHWQGILSIMLLIGLLFVMSMFLSMTGALVAQPPPFDRTDFWWGMGIVLLYVLSYCWLFLQITSAQLTFESGNRSTGIRLTSTVQLVLIWGVIGASIWYSSMGLDRELFITISGLSLMHFIILGLVAATEEDYLSRRIRKSMSRRLLVRLLIAPFMPGGARGLIYVLLNLTVFTLLFTWCASGLMISPSGSTRDVESLLYAVFGIVLYMVIFMAFASWIGRLFGTFSADIRPNHIRVLTLIVFAIGCILPLIGSAADLIKTRDYSYFYLTNPFSTIPELARLGLRTEPILITLGAAALLAVAVNLRAMWTGLSEILALEGDDRTAPIAVNPFHIPAETEPQPTGEA